MSCSVPDLLVSLPAVLMLAMFVYIFKRHLTLDAAWNEGFDAASMTHDNNNPIGHIIGQNTVDNHVEIMVEHRDGTCARYRKVEV